MSNTNILIVVFIISLAIVVGNCAAQDSVEVMMEIPVPEVSISIPEETVELTESGEPGLFSGTTTDVSFILDCWGAPPDSFDLVASDIGVRIEADLGHMYNEIQALENPLSIRFPEQLVYETLDANGQAYANYACGEHPGTIGFQQQLVNSDPSGTYGIILRFEIYPYPRSIFE